MTKTVSKRFILLGALASVFVFCMIMAAISMATIAPVASADEPTEYTITYKIRRDHSYGTNSSSGWEVAATYQTVNGYAFEYIPNEHIEAGYKYNRWRTAESRNVNGIRVENFVDFDFDTPVTSNTVLFVYCTTDSTDNYSGGGNNVAELDFSDSSYVGYSVPNNTQDTTANGFTIFSTEREASVPADKSYLYIKKGCISFDISGGAKDVTFKLTYVADSTIKFGLDAVGSNQTYTSANYNSFTSVETVSLNSTTVTFRNLSAGRYKLCHDTSTACYVQKITITDSITHRVRYADCFVPAQIVSEGSLLTEPTAPSKAYYNFDGWYSDSALTQQWNFETDTVQSNTTLYPKYSQYTISYYVRDDNDFQADDGWRLLTTRSVLLNGTAYNGTAPLISLADNELPLGYYYEGWYTREQRQAPLDGRNYDYTRYESAILSGDISLYINCEKTTSIDFRQSEYENFTVSANVAKKSEGFTIYSPTSRVYVSDELDPGYSHYLLMYDGCISFYVSVPTVITMRFEVNDNNSTFGLDAVEAGVAYTSSNYNLLSRGQAVMGVEYVFTMLSPGRYKYCHYGSEPVAIESITLQDAPSRTVSFTGTSVEIPDQIVVLGQTAEEPQAPMISGYTFMGWYNGQDLYDFSTPVTADLTLHAYYVAITYTVNYAYLNYSSVTVSIGARLEEPPAPTRTGSTFIGWFNEATNEQWDFENDFVDSDLTLYPKFSLNTYTIHFNYDGYNDISATFGSHVDEPATPVLEGYTFNGWYKDEALTQPFNFTRDTVSGDMTLYASFSRNTTEEAASAPEWVDDVSEFFGYTGTSAGIKLIIVVMVVAGGIIVLKLIFGRK